MRTDNSESEKCLERKQWQTDEIGWGGGDHRKMVASYCFLLCVLNLLYSVERNDLKTGANNRLIIFFYIIK